MRALITGLLVVVPLSACDCGENIASIPVAHIEGTLCDAGGRVYAEQNVVLDSAGEKRTVQTDELGFFEARDLPPGELVLLTDDRRVDLSLSNEETLTYEDPNCDYVAPPVELGDVAGRVCAPDGETYLSAADVFVFVPDLENPGEERVIETVTDGEGNFLLEDVPAGEREIQIVKGSFSDVRAVNVVGGQLNTLPEEECAIEAPERIAMVAHSQYERVQDVILELGIDPALVDDYGSDWASQLLADYSVLAQYDIFFLPCRAHEPEFMANEDYVQNLRRFVAEGGSLYTSDQGYDFTERLFPDKIDFFGDDNTLGAADQGAVVNSLIGVVNSPALQAQVGTAVDLHFELSTWSVMSSVAADVEVYVEADAPIMDGSTETRAPMVVGFNHGEGRVVYSSFHQEPGVSADQEEILRFLIFEL